MRSVPAFRLLSPQTRPSLLLPDRNKKKKKLSQVKIYVFDEEERTRKLTSGSEKKKVPINSCGATKLEGETTGKNVNTKSCQTLGFSNNLVKF